LLDVTYSKWGLLQWDGSGRSALLYVISGTRNIRICLPIAIRCWRSDRSEHGVSGGGGGGGG